MSVEATAGQKSPQTQDDLVATLIARVQSLESRVADLESQLAGGGTIRRTFDQKTARTHEMTGRLAQRVAKIEQAVEVLARDESADESES